MAKRYRISGTVSYLNEQGQRLAIPYGTHVEVEELNGEDPAAIMRWKDEQGVARQQTLNLLEWAEYTKRGLKKL